MNLYRRAFNTMKKRTTKNHKRPFAVIPVKTLIVSFIVLVLVYFLFLSGSHNLPRYFRQKAQKNSLMNEIDSINRQNQQLQKEAIRLRTDPDYIEKIAREKYNMKKKGEKVYIIVKEK